MSASVYGGFWNYFTRFCPTYFSAMLGSTSDSCSCVRLRRLFRFTLQKTADSPQLQFLAGRRYFLVWCGGRFPWSCCSADHRDSPVAPVHVVDALVCLSSWFPCRGAEAVSHAFSVFRPKMPVFMAGMDHRTVGASQVHFLDKVFYMPVVVLRVVSWSRQCSLGGSAVAVHHGRHSLLIRRGSSPWSWLFR